MKSKNRLTTAKELLESLQQSQLFNAGTRAVFIDANLYNHGTDTLIEIKLVTF